MDYISKQQKLIEQIEKYKKTLEILKQKRKNEIAELVIKHGLSQLSNEALESHFKSIAKALNDTSNARDISNETKECEVC